MFFLAVATSFPEIVTGATAVFSLGRIGLGYGDIVGSIVVNFMILFSLDYLYKKGRILSGISDLTRLTGFFVPVVTGVVLVASMLRALKWAPPALGMVGIESVVIVVVYCMYLRIVSTRSKGEQESNHDAGGSFWKIWIKFFFLLIIVMLLGVWIAKIGDKIVSNTGLSQTFTGTLILGAATSLPEIIVSFAALKAGSVDMAVANILGSNLFDICIIPFLDLLSKEPILGMLTPGQMLATTLVLVLSGIVIAGIVSKKDRPGRFSGDTSLIFALGLIGFVLLYFVK